MHLALRKKSKTTVYVLLFVGDQGLFVELVD